MSAPAISARSATKTVVAQAAARAVSLGAVLLSTVIVTRTIGVGVFTDWATVLTLTALIAFALDPGLSPVVVRRLAQQPDQAPSSQAMIPLRLGLGAFAYAVVVAVSVGLRGGDALVLALALGGQLIPRTLILNATPWLQLDHRLHRQTMLEAGAAFAGLALLAAAALADLAAPVLGLVGFTIPTAVLVVFVNRELRRAPSHTRVAPGPPMRERVRAVVAEVLPLALALLCVAAYTRSFVIFLNGADFPDEDVADYLFAFLFVEQLIVGAGIVAGTALPLLALRGEGPSLLGAPETHAILRALGAIGALGAAAILALAAPATELIGGDKYASAADDLQLLAPIAATMLPSFVLAYLYLAAGLIKRCLACNVMTLAANLVANALLVPEHGPLASARISWASEALVAALMLIGVARSGRAGTAVVLRLGATLAAAVACAELVAADVLAPLAGAAVLAAAAAAIGARDLSALARSIRTAPRREP